jgi:hypothetical protein
MASNSAALLVEAVNKVSAQYDADVFIYSGSIDESGFGKLIETIPLGRDKPNALLILTTNGGSANAAYQIARLFQKTYQKFILFIPSSCKSAGTLIALGAHRLIMTPVISELGPLDVQLAKQNEIFARKSGLLTRSSFEALGDVALDLYEKLMLSITLKSQGLVGFKLASELSAEMAAKLVAPIFAQINPDVVGGENRDLNVALHYGTRLSDFGMNADIDTVVRLVHGYPSQETCSTT